MLFFLNGSVIRREVLVIWFLGLAWPETESLSYKCLVGLPAELDSQCQGF